jgi:hypothetical protein
VAARVYGHRTAGQFYFEDIIQGEINFRNVIMKADMAAQQVTIVAGGNPDARGNNYRSPVGIRQGQDSPLSPSRTANSWW